MDKIILFGRIYAWSLELTGPLAGTPTCIFSAFFIGMASPTYF
jgi:hypothetical protein